MTLLELPDKKFDAPGIGLLFAMAAFFGIILVSAALHYLAVCVRGWPPQEEYVEDDDDAD